MVVTLGVGSLAVVSLVVVTVVCVLVTLLLTILNRSSRPRMEHCSHCHRPVFIKGAKVPPYYNCQLSPRAAGPVTWSPGEGGQISCLLEGQPSAHNSLVFKRSCSTRKKIRTHPTESEAGSFFRWDEGRVVVTVTDLCQECHEPHQSFAETRQQHQCGVQQTRRTSQDQRKE